MKESFGADSFERIALQMTSALGLPEVLASITSGLVEDFDAAFARIWLIQPGDLCSECCNAPICQNRDQCLHLAVSAGMYTHIDGDHRRVPIGALKIGGIAQEGRPLLTNDLMSDDRVPNKSCVQEKGLCSFAGYPLFFQSQNLGVLALFSRRRIEPDEFARIGLFANQAAVAIKNAQLFEALKKSEAESQLILTSAAEGIYGLDLEGRTTFVNPAAAQMFGMATRGSARQTTTRHYPSHPVGRKRLRPEGLPDLCGVQRR